MIFKKLCSCLYMLPWLFKADGKVIKLKFVSHCALLRQLTDFTNCLTGRYSYTHTLKEKHELLLVHLGFLFTCLVAEGTLLSA